MIPAPRHDPVARPEADEQRQLDHVRQDLAREFTSLPVGVVDDLVNQQVATFRAAPVRSFVPVLVRRGARDRLRQLV